MKSQAVFLFCPFFWGNPRFRTSRAARNDGFTYLAVVLISLWPTMNCTPGRFWEDSARWVMVAVGIKATAVHALLTAATVAGMSERLNSFAAVLEAVIPADSEPPANDDEPA
jgi:hypothetical protein